MLLQRTPVPVLRALAQLDGLTADRAAVILRSSVAVAAMGAYNSVAGATVFNVTVVSGATVTPASGLFNSTFTVSATTGTALNLGISVSGAPGNPKSWSIKTPPALPAGLSVTGGSPINVVAPYKMYIAGTPTTAGTTSVTVVAWDGLNGTGGNSSKITVTFNLTGGSTSTAPTIVTQPASQAVTTGGTATFTVAAAGNPTPTYQWAKGGVNLSGATNATLTLSNVQAANAGTYTAVATNSAGTATSAGAVLTVSASAVAPAITTQPASQTVTAGGAASFTVVTAGSPTPTYQWAKDGVNLAGATNAMLTLDNVQAADAGTYTVAATNSAGTATSTGAVLTVTATAVPVLVTEPQGHTVATGGAVVLEVGVSGGGLSYQWWKDGLPLTGATASQLLLSNVQAGDAGSYTATASNSSGAVTSGAAVLTVVAASAPGRLVNLSVRTGAGTGDSTLIVGFVAGGGGTSGTKPLLIRSVGPTLASYGVMGTLVDPNLELIPQGASVPLATNDNWAGDAQLTAVGNTLGAFPMVNAASKDAALYLTPASGVYTAKVTGVGGTSGIALAEIYDASATAYTISTPRLINVSARAQVGTGDGVLIAGFVVDGTTSRTVLIRVVGPTLGTYGVVGALVDPELVLTKSVLGATVVVATNDNWGGDANITSVGNWVGAFALSSASSKDAAILVSLPPGVYSAKASGVGGTTGVALIEVYEVP